MLNNYCPECDMPASGKFCVRCSRPTISAELDCPFGGEMNPHKTMVWNKFCGECGKPIQEAIKEHIQKEREEVKNGNSNTRNKDN